MKVDHIVSSLSNLGGPAYSVPALSRALTGLGIDSRLLAPDGNIGDARRWGAPATNTHFIRELIRDSREGAVVHNHGLWRWPNVLVGLTRKLSGKSRLVISPRGMMHGDAWAIRRFRKELFWRSAQRIVLSADCFHVTSTVEAEWVRKRGYRGPIVCIPNGVDLPTLSPRHERTHRTVLYLGRLAPIKGLDLLLQAWAALEPAFPGWRLRLVGPDESGTLTSLKYLASMLRLKRVSFSGSVAGEQKRQAFENTDVFVLPSKSENFGLVVAEALAYRLPAVASRGAPWSELEEHRCGRWVERTRDGLSDGLKSLMMLSDEARQEYGRRGRQLVSKRYSWPTIASSFRDVYEWLNTNSQAAPSSLL
ncbi:MAG: glycosyltransferase [Myxococcota bacterium]